MLGKLLDRFRKDRRARREGEWDAPAQMGDPVSRATGGGSDAGTQDAHSTTGTTSNETYVGRVSGDESGDVGMSGSEARGDEDIDEQGAARRED